MPLFPTGLAKFERKLSDSYDSCNCTICENNRVYYVKLTVTLIKIAVNYSIFYNNVTKFLVIVSLNFLVYFPDLQKSQE